MHSVILQISEEPILTDAYISEHDFEDHWFLHDVADFVSENRDTSMEWFFELVGAKSIQYDSGETSFILPDGFCKAYFSHAYQRFYEAIDKLRTSTLDDFCANTGSIGNLLHDLQFSYNDTLSYYVYLHPSTELITLSDFLRSASENTRYYIGGTLDYHF